MASKIKIYKDSPTANLQDGTMVSEEDWSNAVDSGFISIPDTSFTSGNWIKLSIRCDADYKTVLDLERHARINLTGTENIKWQLALDDAGSPSSTPSDWGSYLDIVNEINDTNTIFWARAKAVSGEIVMNDQTTIVSAQALTVVSAPAPWTLPFEDMTWPLGSGEYSNEVIPPENCNVYMEFVGNINPGYILFYVNGVFSGGYNGSTWGAQTFALTQGGTLRFAGYSNNAGYFDLIMHLDDVNGRIVSNSRCTFA